MSSDGAIPGGRLHLDESAYRTSRQCTKLRVCAESETQISRLLSSLEASPRPSSLPIASRARGKGAICWQVRSRSHGVLCNA